MRILALDSSGLVATVAIVEDEQTIADEAFKIFTRSYKWQKPLRSITVTAINLEGADEPAQLSFLCDCSEREKRGQLHRAIDEIHELFGKDSLFPAIILGESKMPNATHDEIAMPGWMHV